ncbi:putative methyltransferase C9orf114 homolog isoform X2 [Bacillus rossius redtenbacheri]|uniref:putative methyltransferase C9orf114 homolog isoform X2 n=1 Tax=Bacillus rossius redtenbacheri TaxID=93214 RepID=UPI002FDCF6F5
MKPGVGRMTRDEYVKLKKRKEEKKRLKQERLAKRAKAEGEREAEEDGGSSATTSETRTLSIAVPGSILENAQSAELRTYLAGQIARAACIFEVDEVIVYDDLPDTDAGRRVGVDEQVYGVRTVRRCCAQLARVLQYLECPQYLRRSFFPVHKDLEYAGLLNPLDAPHHLRQADDFAYREGIVTNHAGKAGHSYVNVGLLKEVSVKKELAPGLRVTVKLLPDKSSKKLRGEVVAPSEPRAATGVYWGYTVRIAQALSDVFCRAPYPGGYDVTLGTSDRGVSVHGLAEGSLSQHRHALVVFGGLQGLEAALESDDKLTVDDPALLFDHYLNTCPGQGSRTIRTEEAVLVSLAVLRPKFSLCEQRDNFKHTAKN